MLVPQNYLGLTWTRVQSAPTFHLRKCVIEVFGRTGGNVINFLRKQQLGDTMTRLVVNYSRIAEMAKGGDEPIIDRDAMILARVNGLSSPPVASGAGEGSDDWLKRAVLCRRWEQKWTAIARRYKLFDTAGPEVGCASRFGYADSHEDLLRQIQAQQREGCPRNLPIGYANERCAICMDGAGQRWLLLERDRVVAEDVPLGESLREHGIGGAAQLLREIELSRSADAKNVHTRD